MNTLGYRSIFQRLFLNKLYIGFLLFIGIIFVYMIPMKTWGLVGEDYSTLFQALHTKSFIDAFIYGDVSRVSTGIINVPMNNITPGFFSVLYRPVWLIFCKITYSLFGLNAYAYLILSIVLHALVSLFLFYWLSLIIDSRMSAILTLFFAFHPSLSWIGKLDNAQYILSLLFGLGSIICFNMLMVAGLLMFLLCLLTRETLIFLPLLLVVSDNKKNKFFTWDLLLGFGLVILCYGLLRNINYPLFPLVSANSADQLVGQFTMHNYFSGLFVFFSNCFGMHIPYFSLWGTLQQTGFLFAFNYLRILCYVLLIGWLVISLLFTNIQKLLTIGTFLVGFFFIRPWPFNGIFFFMFLITCLLFFTNKHPRLICATLLVGCVFIWPQLLYDYPVERFWYEALPVFILVYAYLSKYSNLDFILIRKQQLFYFFLPFLLLTTLYVQEKRHNLAYVFGEQHHKILELKKYKSLLNKNPIFVINNNCGINFALLLHGITDKEAPHFNYRRVYLVSNLSFSDSFSIEIVNCGVHITSKDSSNAWIRENNPCNELPPLFLDSIEINDKNSRGDIFDLTFKFKKQFFYENMKIIVWSESDKKFVVV